MIVIMPRPILMACEWLNERYPHKERVGLIYLHGYDYIESQEGEGPAAYNPETKAICMADISEIAESCGLSEDEARQTALENLFHEFAHFIQDIEGKPFDEDEAEEFASNAYKEYSASGLREYCIRI